MFEIRRFALRIPHIVSNLTLHKSEGGSLRPDPEAVVRSVQPVSPARLTPVKTDYGSIFRKRDDRDRFCVADLTFASAHSNTAVREFNFITFKPKWLMHEEMHFRMFCSCDSVKEVVAVSKRSRYGG